VFWKSRLPLYSLRLAAFTDALMILFNPSKYSPVMGCEHKQDHGRFLSSEIHHSAQFLNIV
jgi:hypothetical protein